MALMRFFTPEWWCGLQSTADRGSGPWAGYDLHLARLIPRMPPDLQQFVTRVSLHDGHLRAIDVALTEASLRLTVDGNDDMKIPRRYTLHYSGVWSFRSVGDPECGLPGPYGFGDWGYDEVDVSPSGEWEHRILYSSGIEMQIRFGSFRLRCEPELPWRVA